MCQSVWEQAKGLCTTYTELDQFKLASDGDAVVQQVARGHNIILDGWARAYNPHPYPLLPHAHSHTQTFTTVSS